MDSLLSFVFIDVLWFSLIVYCLQLCSLISVDYIWCHWVAPFSSSVIFFVFSTEFIVFIHGHRVSSISSISLMLIDVCPRCPMCLEIWQQQSSNMCECVAKLRTPDSALTALWWLAMKYVRNSDDTHTWAFLSAWCHRSCNTIIKQPFHSMPSFKVVSCLDIRGARSGPPWTSSTCHILLKAQSHNYLLGTPATPHSWRGVLKASCVVSATSCTPWARSSRQAFRICWREVVFPWFRWFACSMVCAV